MSEQVKYKFLDLGLVNAPYREEIESAALRVCRSGRFVGGMECEQLEENLCRLTGAPYAIGVSNGLDALRLTLRAWVEMGRLKEGDEVIVPANTFVASVLAIADAGLRPVLAEPSESTMNLDTARLGEYLTPRTRAVMPVHLYGRVCWDERLADFVRTHDLLVLEDNAQGIGAVSSTEGLFGTNVSGGLGHAGAFSFYPTKNLGALGDAGVVVTHDKDMAFTVRALANYGSDRRYHNIYAGFNCRLDPIQAAFLNAKFPYLEKINADRRHLADIYSETISNPAVTLPLNTPDCVWHQYVVRTDRRDDFRRYLADNGVETDIHYADPAHRQPCFASLAHAPLPVTDRLADTVVSLPISSCTTPADARAIACIINAWRP